MAQTLKRSQVEPPLPKSSVSNPQKKRQDSRFQPVTGKQVLLLAAWFGLMTGLIESLANALNRYVMGNFIFCGDSIFYITPVGQAVVAMTLCLPLAFIATRGKACSEHLVVSLLAFLASYSTAMLIPNLHYLAELMLALGVASQAGRWVEKNPGKLTCKVRAGLAFPVSVVLIIFVFSELLPSLQEQRSLANLPAADADAPNVLLVVLDTVRSDALDLSAPARTPNLQRLAKEGFLFEQAHATCPWTLPSHASMFTSRLPHELSSGWNSAMKDEFPTIAEWLQERGYRTGGFVGNTIYCSGETGLDRGFIHYEDYVLSLEQLLLSTTWSRHLANSTLLPLRLGCYDNLARRRAPGIRENLTQWLDATDHDHPYFVMVNLFDAHDPYAAPKQYRRFTPTNLKERQELRYWWLANKEKVTEQQVAAQRTAYEDCIAHLDHQVGLLFEELRRRGDLENTLVIVTADHGEHFGDHKLYGHGNSLYEASIHVPMIVWSSDMRFLNPNAVNKLSHRALFAKDQASAGLLSRIDSTEHNKGKRSDVLVSLCDLPATIADYVAPGVSHPFQGQSLMQHMRQNDNGLVEAAPIFSQIAAPSRWPSCGGKSPVFRGPMKSVLYQGLKYIRNGDGVEEVYDVVEDPQELIDLIETLPKKQLQELRTLIDQQVSS